MKEYLSSKEQVLSDLSAGEQGLSSQEASSRLSQYGLNKLAEGKQTTLLQRFLSQLADPMIIILIVAAGDARIDNVKYKARFGGKAKMIGGADTEAWTGHAPGGVCPFAVKPGVSVYLDVSLKRFGTVFPACGSANSAIEVTPGELEKFSGRAEWIDVCKNWSVPALHPGA